MALQIRRGSDAERQGITPSEGELIYVTDTNQLYIGGKIAPSSSLEQGGIIVSGDLVNDTSPTLSGDLDLNNNDITGTGNININGTITATGNINLGDGVEDNVIVGGQIGSSLIPGATESYNLGDPSGRWSQVHTVGLNAEGIVVNGETNTGTLVLGNNIIADDSTVIYDGTAKILTANAFVGDLSGSVFGDDSTLIVDGINNVVNADSINTGSVLSDSNLSPINLINSFRTPVKVQTVTSGTQGGYPYFEINSVKDSLDNPLALAAGEVVGAWKITGYTGGSSDPSTVIGVGSFAPSATVSDDSPESVFTLITGAGGTSFNLFNFDHIGQITAPGPVTPGVFADPTARDAAIATPAAGMIVFLTDSTGSGGAAKHQGYDGSSWNDLY